MELAVVALVDRIADQISMTRLLLRSGYQPPEGRPAGQVGPVRVVFTWAMSSPARGLLEKVDPLEVLHQFQSDSFLGGADRVAWLHDASSRRVWAADRYFFAPPGMNSTTS